MCQFIESIRIVDGSARLLDLHEQRMQSTRRAFWKKLDPVSLEKPLEEMIKGLRGIHKCRIVYDQDIQSITLQPYTCRSLSRFKIVHGDHLEYAYKFEDRRDIEELFAERFPADEILIFKKGMLRDGSIYNIVVDDGQQWLTPASPLLKGVMRQSLLNQGMVSEADIPLSAFLSMRRFRLINAMNPFEDAPDYTMESILM